MTMHLDHGESVALVAPQSYDQDDPEEARCQFTTDPFPSLDPGDKSITQSYCKAVSVTQSQRPETHSS